MYKTHLQGMGEVPAVKVSELNPTGGDVVMWNYGYKSIVLRVIPSATGKTAAVTLKSLDSGKVSIRKLGSQRLIAIANA